MALTAGNKRLLKISVAMRMVKELMRILKYSFYPQIILFTSHFKCGLAVMKKREKYFFMRNRT